MAELWQRVHGPVSSTAGFGEGAGERVVRHSTSRGRFWMIADVFTIVVSAGLAWLYRFHTGPVDEFKSFW
ncbi:MAG TPA: hypothetical protein VGG56_10365, partial [Terracidiphilus sp.]